MGCAEREGIHDSWLHTLFHPPPPTLRKLRNSLLHVTPAALPLRHREPRSKAQLARRASEPPQATLPITKGEAPGARAAGVPPARPASRHATAASSLVQPSKQTSPQVPPIWTCTRPLQ